MKLVRNVGTCSSSVEAASFPGLRRNSVPLFECLVSSMTHHTHLTSHIHTHTHTHTQQMSIYGSLSLSIVATSSTPWLITVATGLGGTTRPRTGTTPRTTGTPSVTTSELAAVMYTVSLVPRLPPLHAVKKVGARRGRSLGPRLVY